MTRTSFNWDFGPCPACEKPLLGRVSAEINTDDVVWDSRGGGTVGKLDTKLIGADVSHNCIPVATR